MEEQLQSKKSNIFYVVGRFGWEKKIIWFRGKKKRVLNSKLSFEYTLKSPLEM